MDYWYSDGKKNLVFDFQYQMVERDIWGAGGCQVEENHLRWMKGPR